MHILGLHKEGINLIYMIFLNKNYFIHMLNMC